LARESARDMGVIVKVAFGCYGGRHRSVAMAELAAKALRDAGCDVEIEHNALS
jgi:RNase adaptor protein for sRNA GlmZ degradation